MYLILINLLLVWAQVTESQFKSFLAKLEIYKLNSKEKLRNQTMERRGLRANLRITGAWGLNITRISS